MSVRSLRRGSIAASRAVGAPAGNVLYLSLPGVSGNYPSTPDSAASSISGDIDLRVKTFLANWKAASGTYLVSKYDSGGASYFFTVKFDTGELRLFLSSDGTDPNVKLAESTVVPTVSNGDTLWVRATADIDNGAGGIEVKFYTSADGSTWNQLGATVTVAGALTSIFNSVAPVRIGTVYGTGQMLNGGLYYAEIRNGIDGPVVVKFDPTTVTRTATRTPASFVSSTGETWTMNGSAWDWVT